MTGVGEESDLTSVPYKVQSSYADPATARCGLLSIGERQRTRSPVAKESSEGRAQGDRRGYCLRSVQVAGRQTARRSLTGSRLGGSNIADQSYRADTVRGREPTNGAAPWVHQEDTADTECRYQVGGETLQGVATWRNVIHAPVPGLTIS